MAEMSLAGLGTVRDPHKAVRLFTRAAETGDLRGHYHLGLCYLQGQGVMKDPERALRELTVAAEDGYAPALYRLGLLYRDGIGIRPHHRTAVRLIYTACRSALAESASTSSLSLSLTGRPAGAVYTCITMRQLRRTRLKPILRALLAARGRILSEDALDALAVRSFGTCRITSVTLPEDSRLSALRAAEAEAAVICKKKIAAHGLEMSLVDVEYTFDNSKLIFYFTCESRVDFRELVKDLAATFHTRIELRQIGIRDEAKMMGGLGICGRKYCCAGFLTDFVQVSIKMAKEQNFSLNSSKVSGACGRLMCCLRYEHEIYEEAIKVTPPQNSIVKTPDGVGTVIETRPLAAEIKVKLNDNDKDAPKVYKCSEVKIIKTFDKKEKSEITEEIAED
jgi:cell fate regulator YaaT (PSP1 superfamily)